MVSSVAEGDDKPLKYPLMFRACELVVVNKIDLLQHVDFDMERFLQPRRGAPGRRRDLRVSARTGEGVDAFRDWLARAARPRRRRRPDDRCSRGERRSCGARAGERPSSRAEAERLARLCHAMAERFARGGRLIAFGVGAGRPLRRRATSRSSSSTR